MFWAVVYEVQADRAHRLTLKSSKSKLWVQPAHSLRMEALWVRALSATELTTEEWVNFNWNPELEANPCGSKNKQDAHQADLDATRANRPNRNLLTSGRGEIESK